MASTVADRSVPALYGRLATAGTFLTLALFIGSVGYHTLGIGRWSWEDCFYMTVITIATVGYGEVLDDMHDVPYARIWTMGLIVLGSGTVVYFVSTLTALIVEGDLKESIRRTRMQKQIDHLKQHIIVCGVGTTGIHVVQELIATQTPFVVVDKEEERIQRIMEDLGQPKMMFVIGDAAEDHTLEAAGIARARGVVTALHDDKDNLFVAITARALNPKLRIVAKAVEHSAGEKLKRAGADCVVSPNFIGGLRMVSEMLRPNVVEFLDLMLRDKDKNLRIEEVTIPEGSSLIGQSLRSSSIRSAADVLVIAVRDRHGNYTYNPGPDYRLEMGLTLIVLAQTVEIVKLRSFVTGEPASVA